MGHTIKVVTQGTIGTEDELTAEEIKEADVHAQDRKSTRLNSSH